MSNAFRTIVERLTSSTPRTLWSPLGLSVVLAALASACDEAHPRDAYAQPAGDAAEISAWFYNLYLALDSVILLIVMAVLVAALVKFRRKAGDDTLPEQSFGDTRLEIAWTILPTLIVLGITVPTLGGLFELAKRPDANQKIIEIEVTGKQWWWELDYKKEGINTGNEMHVEVDTQVMLHLTSADVIHAWWVPRLSGKRDATPGRSYPLNFRPKEVGSFDGQCAELCGASHALMGIRIIVHPHDGPDSYANWVKHTKEAAPKVTTPEAEAGQKVFMSKGCVACHTIEGVSELAAGARSRTSGPNLTHVGSRDYIAAHTLKNSPENIAKWVKNPQQVKPGALMTNLGLNDQEAKDVAAFLTALK